VLLLGKAHKGKKFDDVPLEYLIWMADKFKVWSKSEEETENLEAVRAYVKLPLVQKMIEEQGL